MQHRFLYVYTKICAAAGAFYVPWMHRIEADLRAGALPIVFRMWADEISTISRGV